MVTGAVAPIIRRSEREAIIKTRAKVRVRVIIRAWVFLFELGLYLGLSCVTV